MPVYWVLPRGALRDHPRLLEEMQVTAPTPVTVEYVYVPAVDRVGLVLTNKTNAPQRPEIEVEGAKSTVELPAGAKAASREVSLPRALAIDIRRTLRVAVTAGGRRQSLTHAVSLEPLPAPPAAFRADGDLAEWSATRAFDLRDRKDVLPPDPGIGWDGPDDLSLRAYLAADGRGLYFAAAVTDGLHAAPNADPDNFWESDSLQLALDPTGDSHAGFDADDREVGFVLGADGPRAFLSYPAPRRRIEAPLAIVRTDSQTRHEVFLPWSALGVPTPRARQVLAIDFIANENDGRGRACWMGLTPGIGEAKTPSAYRRFVMP
jgi:hypothetical protein